MSQAIHLKSLFVFSVSKLTKLYEFFFLGLRINMPLLILLFGTNCCIPNCVIDSVSEEMLESFSPSRFI